MSTPKTLQAYADCEEHFERALATERGIALTLESNAQVVRMIQRMNAYRVLLRNRNKQIYEQGDSRYGISVFDKFKVARDPNNELRILIQPYDQKIVNVEEL